MSMLETRSKISSRGDIRLSRVVPEVLSRDSRARRFGIDCPSELHWHAKEPGGDYKQKLTIKNVSTQVIKFKYKLPETSFFFLKFPDLFTLNPGMAASIDVNFRPIRSEPYDDVIEFITTQGNFFIRVIATMPEHGVKMQEHLDFGFATVKEESTRTFVLRNIGEVNAPFELLSEAPFDVHPKEGVIFPGKTMTVKISFFPTEASVYVGTIVCKQPIPRPALVMKISGIGKIPFVAISKSEVDFGTVLTGRTVNEEVILTNTSLVPVSFELNPVPHDHDPIFHWKIVKGKIPADGSLALQVAYTPISTGSFDCDYFEIVTPGGNIQRICCKGFAEPHSVEIDRNSINFGNLELGKVSLRTLEIRNNTKEKAFYQFITESQGCFEFSRTDGSIIQESSVNVDIRFTARVPGNFYRRIFILIKNQGPLYLDLTATAYHQNQDQVPRPMPLAQKHVDMYRARQMAERTAHARAIYDVTSSNNPMSVIWNEFFLDDTDSRREIYLLEQHVEFGAASEVGVGDYKQITVHNNTEVKQTAMFMIPPDNYVKQPEGAGEITMTTLGPVLKPLETCFKVFPDKADVLPKSSTTFKVAFRPEYRNAYYAQAVEIFVFPKTQRNFRLVTDENFVPPHCVTPVCSGNTFPIGMEAFTPKLRVPSTRISFPACAVGDKAYQIIEMYNDADTPLRYLFGEDETGVFRCKPNNGLIMPHCAQLVAFMFCPLEAKRYEHVTTCVLNGSSVLGVKLTLIGRGNATSIELETYHLQVKPTSVGSVTTRAIDMKNPTGIPIFYQCLVPESCSRVLAVEPDRGILRGNEKISLFVHFAPRREGSYSLKVPIDIDQAKVRSLADAELEEVQELEDSLSPRQQRRSLPSKQTVHLNVYGMGTVGAVTFEPETVDFGTLVVGTQVSRVIKLVNHSDCTMYHNIVSSMEKNLEYKDGKGFISAFSTKRVTICFTPSERKYYNVTITCRLSTSSESLVTGDHGSNRTGIQLLQALEFEDAPQCQVLGNAVYPVLSIIDARAAGSVFNPISTSRVWREFSLMKMNKELSSDLNRKEVKWNKAEIDETDPTKVLQVMEMRFEVKEQGYPPSMNILRLKNTGVLALDFLLKFPKDDEDEPENWVDKDLQGEEELTLNMILENKLFLCEPRRGHLEVGEEVDLIVSYKHLMPTKEFRLPVVLNICELPAAGGVLNTGKQIVLSLIGQTLAIGEAYLHLPSPDAQHYKHLEWGFEKTPIGLIAPPIQYYKLENLGQVPLDYHIDMSEVEKLNADNFGFDIVTCLDNTDWHLEPGESLTMRWVFNPLEAKMYSWQLPISVYTGESGGDTHVVKFYAEGYQPSVHSNPETTVWQMPASQIMPTPNQLVIMTGERFCMGDIPLGATIHRMIILTNFSHEHVMTFRFELDGELAKQMVVLHPQSGEIDPLAHAVVKMTVRCMTSSILDFDVPCMVAPKLEPEEENEDLADDNEDAAPAASVTGRPSTGLAPSTSGGSTVGTAKSARRRKRTSVIELPPPMRSSVRLRHGGTRGFVSFQERNDGKDSGNRTQQSFMDDTASVKSGSSRISAATAQTSASMVSALSSVSRQTGIGSAHMEQEEDDEGSQQYLFLSLQAHVRPPEQHRSLHENNHFFWFPKSSFSSPDGISPNLRLPTAASSAASDRRSPSLGSGHDQSPASTATGPRGNSAAGSRPSTRDAGQQSQLRAKVTEGILEQLLNDIINDEQILNSFSQLEDAPVPCFVQVAKRPPAIFQCEDQTRNREVEDGGTEAAEEAKEGRKRRVYAGIDVPGHSAEVPLELSEEEEEKLERDTRRRKAMSMPEFENLAAFVLNACIFNFLEELTFGEEQA
mmetsp:Transcript_9855/g.22507  ORF Transcript_9855/g.22507 Transcript_9855/m.22507 type:complete len:1836 (-) Transcript_9855:105-5612(-)